MGAAFPWRDVGSQFPTSVYFSTGSRRNNSVMSHQRGYPWTNRGGVWEHGAIDKCTHAGSSDICPSHKIGQQSKPSIETLPSRKTLLHPVEGPEATRLWFENSIDEIPNSARAHPQRRKNLFSQKSQAKDLEDAPTNPRWRTIE